jgi:hypothetical protein
MIHLQLPVPSWLEAVQLLPPNSLVKAVDNIGALVDAKATNQGINTVLRHWYDPQQIFGGTWDDNLRRAGAFFDTFIDDTFKQHAHAVNFVEGWNEYLANSQTQAEINERVLWARAAAQVWAQEYRPQNELNHIRLVICNTAVGNDIDWRFAEIADEFDCLIGYHPYTHWTTGVNGPVRSEGDWQYLSGRWATMDADYRARGFSVDWLFTEAGPYEGAIDGWRSTKCLAGSQSAYVDAVRLWIQDVAQTDAYREGRIYGFALFTTGRAGNTWRHFWTEQPELNALAQMTRDEWQPAPPPPPPDCRGEPRVQYQRVYNVIHPSATEDQAVAVFLDGWRRSRETTGGSFDDAGIGDLDERTARLYGVPAGQEALYDDFYSEHYPGVAVSFRDLPQVNGAFVVNSVVDQLPIHPNKMYGTRRITDITTLVIHHTTGTTWDGVINIASYHINHNDWPGIGYHYVINEFGQIYLTNELETVSYHTGGENDYTVGIALQGDFTHDPPPPMQLAATQRLVNHLRGALGITGVLGHKEAPGQNTACPGATWGQDWHIT